jgi:sugar/nucleoside kinase (ribokinase family)
MIVDTIYPVQGLPRAGELTTIKDGIMRASGGALCNVIIDLAIMDSTLPLTALGRLGTDAEGDFLLETLSAYKNIDLSLIRREGKTSFTAVMADEISKERTFFHYRGANAALSEDDFDWERISGGLLHIGYILLLDALDEEDAEYGTKMARLLCHARERGLKTSLDVVSEFGDRFKRIVPPALKYADYCIINEIEAEQISGIKIRDEAGFLVPESLKAALERIKNFGVSEWAIIHSAEGGFGLDQNWNYSESPALKLSPYAIKGKVGAGDAFCAGVLYTVSHNGKLEEGLELGNAAAAACLLKPGAVEGMLPVDALRRLKAAFP